MTEQRKANIIELFDGAKDQKEQIELITKMGFGTKREIIDLLHETGRALDITIRRPATKKEEPKEEVQETPEEKKRGETAPDSAGCKATPDGGARRNRKCDPGRRSNNRRPGKREKEARNIIQTRCRGFRAMKKRPYKPPTVESLVFTLGFCTGMMIGMFGIMLYMLYLALN